MDKTILIIAALLIFVAYVTNVFVTLKASQHNIDKLTGELKETVQQFVDILPLLMLKTKKEDISFKKLRDDWYDNWNDPEKHWEIYKNVISLSEEMMKSDIDAAQETIKRAKNFEREVDGKIHEYNEALILRENKLKSWPYLLANLLLKQTKYEHLTSHN